MSSFAIRAERNALIDEDVFNRIISETILSYCEQFSVDKIDLYPARCCTKSLIENFHIAEFIQIYQHVDKSNAFQHVSLTANVTIAAWKEAMLDAAADVGEQEAARKFVNDAEKHSNLIAFVLSNVMSYIVLDVTPETAHWLEDDVPPANLPEWCVAFPMRNIALCDVRRLGHCDANFREEAEAASGKMKSASQFAFRKYDDIKNFASSHPTEFSELMLVSLAIVKRVGRCITKKEVDEREMLHMHFLYEVSKFTVFSDELLSACADLEFESQAYKLFTSSVGGLLRNPDLASLIFGQFNL